MAIQSTFKNMVLCLFVICITCSTLMAVVYAVTAEPIAAAAAKKTSDAIAMVVPEFEGSPEQDAIEVEGTEYTYYTVSKAGSPVGYAIMTSSTGFGGSLNLMVGITSEGVIYNTSVLSQSETPGLGAKCVEPAFADQFKSFDPAVKKLSVTKDGGDINAITASTITSRAYCKAVNTALEVFNAITSSSVPVDSSTGASVVEEESVESTEE